MNEQKITQIKDQIRDLMQQITSMGEEPPEFIQDLLMKVIEKAQKQIQELRQQEQAETLTEGNTISAIPPDAQLLWILSGQKEQPFISYLNTYQTPETQALLSNPSALASVISQLNRMMPEGQPQVIDGIQEADLNSSNVWGTAYDPKSGKMKVRFQGGAEYEYDGIPAPIYKAVAQGNASAKTKGKNQYGEWWPNKNPSLGAALNQYIKAGGFAYRRIR